MIPAKEFEGELWIKASDHHRAIKTAQRSWVGQPAQERNFCSRCGKRTADLTTIHTCTPPQDKYESNTPT
jgi:hypothetical protein